MRPVWLVVLFVGVALVGCGDEDSGGGACYASLDSLARRHFEALQAREDTEVATTELYWTWSEAQRHLGPPCKGADRERYDELRMEFSARYDAYLSYGDWAGCTFEEAPPPEFQEGEGLPCSLWRDVVYTVTCPPDHGIMTSGSEEMADGGRRYTIGFAHTAVVGGCWRCIG